MNTTRPSDKSPQRAKTQRDAERSLQWQKREEERRRKAKAKAKP